MKRRGFFMLGVTVLFVFAMNGLAAASPQTIEYITATSHNPESNGIGKLYGAGPVAGVGHDHVVSPHLDRFVFADGSLTVHHEPVTRTQTRDLRTCTFTTHETGTYTVPFGTGAYLHAFGSGTYTLQVTATGCDRNAPPTSFSLVLQAHGPLSLGS